MQDGFIKTQNILVLVPNLPLPPPPPMFGSLILQMRDRKHDPGGFVELSQALSVYILQLPLIIISFSIALLLEIE